MYLNLDIKIPLRIFFNRRWDSRLIPEVFNVCKSFCFVILVFLLAFFDSQK